MEHHNYYSDYGNDELQPKRPVTHMLLDEYFRQRIDKEIDRLTAVIEKKTDILSALIKDVDMIKIKLGLKNERSKLKEETE